MPITLALPYESNVDEVAEALYYAYKSAKLMLIDEPNQEPPTVLWEDLTDEQRAVWRGTMSRLVALYLIPEEDL